jgi:hypothetical protein
MLRPAILLLLLVVASCGAGERAARRAAAVARATTAETPAATTDTDPVMATPPIPIAVEHAAIAQNTESLASSVAAALQTATFALG